MKKEVEKDVGQVNKKERKEKVERKPEKRSLTVKEIRDERELLKENIAQQFEKFRRRTGLKVTYCEYNIDESEDVFLAIEDI